MERRLGLSLALLYQQELQQILIHHFRLFLLDPMTALGDVLDLKTIAEVLVHVVGELFS